MELQNFLNDVVIGSPHLGGVRSTTCPSTAPGGGEPTRKRNLDDPFVVVVAVDVEAVTVVGAVAYTHLTLPTTPYV